jgi:superfamily II DNA or RNA helicase
MSKPQCWITGVGVIRTNPHAVPSQTPEYEILEAALKRIHDQTPIQLTTITQDREAMLYVVKSKWCIVQRKAKDAMIRALEESDTIDPPLIKSTDYELIAWTDEFHTLKCKANIAVHEGKVFTEVVKYAGGVYDADNRPYSMDWTKEVITAKSQMEATHSFMNSSKESTAAKSKDSIPEWNQYHFRKDKEYEVRLFTRRYSEPFTRMKAHYNAQEKELYQLEHEMVLHGKDAMYRIYDDNDNGLHFIAHPEGYREIQEGNLWNIFHKPDVPTVKEIYPEEYKSAVEQLDIIELLQGFTYFEGQKDYTARMSCMKSGLIAAETGCGKSLIAISLIMLKNVDRCLIIAPKGTVEEGSDFHVAQWSAELKKFGCQAPVRVLTNRKQYDKLIEEHGELPRGVYLTWPQAMFTSGDAFEAIPQSWPHPARESKTRARFGYKEPEDEDVDEEDGSVPDRLSVGLGAGYDGIRCIGNPSLATRVGGKAWDMVILDEAHLICNIESQTTKSMIRLEPPYRYALTATPLPNMVFNLFSLLGWLCVPKWHHGGWSNKKWPYTKDELSTFKEHFCSYEEDLTDKQLKMQRGVKNPSSMKPSPIISQAGRLLKLLKPSMAYISKIDCNPDMVECKVHTTAVPMGAQQFNAYAHIIQPQNMPFSDPKNIKAVQSTWLRGLCAAPVETVHEYHKRAKVNEDDPDIININSNFNPKTIAILEKIYECLANGDQVVHVSARVNQSTEIERRLDEAGIKVSRIDSTRSKHSVEAAKFKAKETQVLLMGINCAQSYSFEQCNNLIIGSLEWSYGKFNQAQGRVWRLISQKPINIYVILHKDTIEELLFEKLGLKEDAATICLKGMHVPREIHAVHPDEIMSDHVFNFNRKTKNICEEKCEEDWPILRARIRTLEESTS